MKARFAFVLLVVHGFFLSSSAFSQDVNVDAVLKHAPQYQADVQTPTKAEYAQCKIKLDRKDKVSGWVVTGPQGEILRKFLDTNADGAVDLRKYYNLGIEVYRDIDSDYNGKLDQARWLNTGGTKWGIDENEDKVIDSWKYLSAEEAAREAVEAILSKDIARLQKVMVTPQEIKSLGFTKTYADLLNQSLSTLDKQFQGAVAAGKALGPNSKWSRFDGTKPGLIPADSGKATSDLLVYENTIAMVETKGTTTLFQVGEIIKIDNTWKLTAVPQPLEGNSIQVAAGGYLMQPVSSTSGLETEGLSPEVQKLLDELQALDQNSPTPSADAKTLATFNAKRADILAKLVNTANNDTERKQWTQQLIDGIAVAVQTGGFPKGLDRLKKLEEQLKEHELNAYVMYRRILAEYSLKMRNSKTNEERQETGDWWLKALEEFATAHPAAPDASDAMLQLAIANEFEGELRSAKQWYGKVVSEHGDSQSSGRAKGALKRLDLNEKPFNLSGKQVNGRELSFRAYKNRNVLIVFWASWSTLNTNDLPFLKELYSQYRAKGFEIIGVSLDSDKKAVTDYVKQHQIPWAQIFEEGGLDSRPALEYGIISLPTMFLVDKKGKVVSNNVNIEDLKEKLDELMPK